MLRMLQLCRQEDDTGRKEMLGERTPLPPALPQPAGAILIGPFVDASNIEENMTDLCQYDWIVSQSVLELVDEDLQNKMVDDWSKVAGATAMQHDMTGICPIILSVSEHECLMPECVKLADKLQNAKVDVTFSTRPYLCHVYQLFAHYLPEAAAEKEKICAWVSGLGGVWASEPHTEECGKSTPCDNGDSSTASSNSDTLSDDDSDSGAGLRQRLDISAGVQMLLVYLILRSMASLKWQHRVLFFLEP